MRKGQAAMEFLMTYGWAILVVLAAIGALAYFGVLSPDRFLPDKCTATPPFSCTAYKVQGGGVTNDVTLFLSNSAGVDMSALSVALTCETAAGTAVAGAPTTLQNGQAGNFTFSCAADPTTGLRWKGNYTITYTKSGESISHTATGSIQVRAE
jgi:hypothetical protein